MTPQEIQTLNTFVDSFRFEYGIIKGGLRAYLHWPFETSRLLTLGQKKLVSIALEQFSISILGPILKSVEIKFVGMAIDQETINDLEATIKNIESDRINRGCLSFKDEIKKRLGVLPDFKRIDSELETLFSEALHG